MDISGEPTQQLPSQPASQPSQQATTQATTPPVRYPPYQQSQPLLSIDQQPTAVTPALSRPLTPSPTGLPAPYAGRDVLGERRGKASGLWRAGRRQSPLFRTLLLADVVLLLVAAVVPMVYTLAAVAPFNRAAPLASTGTSQVAPSGTPDPNGMAWTSALQEAAATTYVDNIIAHMSLDEEIGQMLVTDFTGTDVDADLAAKIEQYHVGGAILYGRNYYSANSLHTLDAHIQAHAKIPLFIAVDQEGGTVDRLGGLDGSHPSAEYVGNRNDPAYARQLGEIDGQDMYKLGVNVNLAPVVDVQNVPDGATYMQYRMYGWTPDKVATMAGAYLQGLQEGGHVIGTLKHFPGLGDIGGDPHQSLVTLNRNLTDLNAVDWAPYKTLIASGQVGMIMTTHVTVPAVDPNTPTTISYPVTTGILRDKLGFQGVIITDDIYMESLAAHYSFAQRVIGCVLAGDDLIASVFTMPATISAEQILHNAVQNGTITKARIDESVRRILLLKVRYGILPMPSASHA